MLKYMRSILSTMLISTTAFLVGCSGCVGKAGDKVTGSGTGTVSSSGKVTGTGSGTVTSQTNGTQSGTQSNGTVNITMQNPTDKIVCTSSAGAVTVYAQGQTISSSGTSTCVVTPANQVPSNAVPAGTTTTSGSGTTTSGSGSNTGSGTTAGSGSNTGSGSGSGTGTGTGSGTTGSNLTTAASPKNSY